MKTTDIGLQKKHWAWIAAGIILLISSISVYIRASEMLHPEGDAYLVDHLSSRPYISKILCPHLIDAEDYEARPVSHFFENIDAHIFYISYLAGSPIFISLCTTAMLLVLSAAVWVCATRYAGIHPAAATLMTVLLWTNPNVFFAGALYRDAKIAATLFLSLAVLYAYRSIALESLTRFRDFAVIFILSLLACLSDPQGVAFAVMLTGIVLVWAFFTASRQAWVTFLSGLGSLLAYLYLSRLVLPELVARYTWFNTRSTFTNFLQTGILNKDFVSNLPAGLLVYLDVIRFLFGNVPRVVIAAGLIMLFAAGFRFPRRRILIGFCLILFAAGNSLMESAMITRHPPVLWTECILSGYYQLPTVVLFFIAILFMMEPLVSSWHIRKSVLAAILAIAICANIIALPQHNKVRIEYKNARNQAGYIAAAPIIRNKLILLSKIKPARHPLPYDAINASNSIVYFLNSDKIVIATGHIRAEDYIITSRIYNFLRSRKGLPYYENWKVKFLQ